MGAGVATVGRRRFAVGLYWQPSPSGRVAQAAKEAARQPGQYAEYYSVRPAVKNGRVAQFGLGQAQAGHKVGMPALATTLANRQPGSWAGAFKVNEGIVVVVVRDDLIAPDGDQIYLDEAAARDRLMQEFTLGGLQRIYAPEAWAISGAETIGLPFIVQSHAEGNLKPVAIPKAWIMGGVISAVVVALVLGGLWYYQSLKEEEERLRQEQLRKQAELMSQTNPQNQAGRIIYPPPVRFWEDEPKPELLVTACREALDKVPTALQGWRLTTLGCSNQGGLNASWNRDIGHTIMPDDLTIDATGMNASRTVAIAQLAKRGKEDLLDPNDITRRFLGQNWNATLSRLPDDPPPPKPPNVPAEEWKPPPPPWVKRGFNVTLTDLPGESVQYFAGVPGVIIQSITSQSGGWSVQGVIYENRR